MRGQKRIRMNAENNPKEESARPFYGSRDSVVTRKRLPDGRVASRAVADGRIRGRGKAKSREKWTGPEAVSSQLLKTNTVCRQHKGK